jgi:hypothetical protein
MVQVQVSSEDTQKAQHRNHECNHYQCFNHQVEIAAAFSVMKKFLKKHKGRISLPRALVPAVHMRCTSRICRFTFNIFISSVNR